METVQTLEPAFKEAIFRFTGDKKIVTDLWKDIEKQYAQSSRHYHNLSHLDHLVNTLLQVKNEIGDWDIMILATAYHDIIYNTRKSDNEEKSAEYADKFLTGILAKEKRKLLSQFIIATKAHGRNVNEDINYFTDADLSILGASSEEYVLYAKQIRKEYKLYPLFIYKPGRAKVLNHFLKMDRIFKTAFFFTKYEINARKNLQTELDNLSK